jgi:hypothetical protein
VLLEILKFIQERHVLILFSTLEIKVSKVDLMEYYAMDIYIYIFSLGIYSLVFIDFKLWQLKILHTHIYFK